MVEAHLDHLRRMHQVSLEIRMCAPIEQLTLPHWPHVYHVDMGRVDRYYWCPARGTELPEAKHD